jgi:hypothetical protein
MLTASSIAKAFLSGGIKEMTSKYKLSFKIYKLLIINKNIKMLK